MRLIFNRILIASSASEKLAAFGRRHCGDGDDEYDYLRSNYEFEMRLCERVSTTVTLFLCFLVVISVRRYCDPSCLLVGSFVRFLTRGIQRGRRREGGGAKFKFGQVILRKIIKIVVTRFHTETHQI